MITEYDEHTVRQELAISQSSTSVPTMGKIALLLPMAFMPNAQFLVGEHVSIGDYMGQEYVAESDSSNTSFDHYFSELDVVVITALGEFHEKLFGEQVDLDGDAKNILYENLWDLYI